MKILLMLLILTGTLYADDIQVLFTSEPIPANAIDRANDRPEIAVEKIFNCTGASTGRVLYDAWFSSVAVAKWARQRLIDAGLNPILITAHKYDASVALDDDNVTELVPMTTPRRNELLRCLPDICTASGSFPPVMTCVRPTIPFQPHKYYGWADRTIN